MGGIPLILCVTGKMAAGKNAASEILSAKGFVAVDADSVVHEILGDSSVVERIVGEFSADAEKRGIRLVRPDGSLDRRSLGALVFSEKALLSRQEAIVLPEVDSRLRAFASGCRARGQDAVINATVLHKIGCIAECDAVIFVDAPFFVRLLRARRRDALPFRRILARFWAQRNLFSKYKKSNADTYRVKNTGDLRVLERNIAECMEKIERAKRGEK